ncbi:MAG: hypothetical protein LBS97_07250 [Treponema sp.]|nr:hypothetical protein [Treponema sp.]
MNPPIPQKQLLTTSAPVEAICYVDVEHYNPLNAKDYVFSANADAPETPFFNYVVLGYSYLTKDSRGYTHLELRPALKYILDNSVPYLKPLHQKGIKVLIEVRSGIFTDDEAGIGAGLGTMDMASINEFIKELKLLVDQYGIDGFDFNDVGGGRNSYSPHTRNLTQFQTGNPLYPDELFRDEKGDTIIDPAKIASILWIEGGSNFSNLIQRTNEALKETYTMTYKNGSLETSDTQSVERIIMVRDRNHGRQLLSQLRMAYMPDAYSGADPKVAGNLKYIIHDVPYDNTRPHASLWDEARQADVGETEADDKYAPFAVDLLDQKSQTETELWAKRFLLKDPDGLLSSAANQNKYGALYFTNLGPVSESADTAGYMTYFSRILFGRIVRLSETPNAGNYKKDW